ncbi:MAG TPA: DUF4129 domain-containing protein [Dongiaceae bacterium]|nr:DUF4129 domain-containing protein [Dongiaceae bacterium]
MGSKEEIRLRRGSAPAFLLPAAFLSLSLLLAPGAVSRADDAQSDESRQAVESAVAGDDIQRNVPIRKTIAEAETPDIQRDPPPEKPLPPPPQIPRVHLNLGWLPYAILALIAVGLLFLVGRYVHYRSGLNAADRDGPAAPGTSTYALAPDEAERDHTFDEVDALAAQGAFGEAIHRLLLLVQERLRSRLEHGFQTSLTSREILRRAKLPGEAKTAFANLVAAVEITLFGQQHANRATYDLCRENSRRVLAAAV